MRVVSFLFPEKNKRNLNGLDSGAPGGNLWIGCKLERDLDSRLKRAGHSKGREAGSKNEKSTASEIIQSSTMPVSHKSSLVQQTTVCA